jgi:hypothetical protein
VAARSAQDGTNGRGRVAEERSEAIGTQEAPEERVAEMSPGHQLSLDEWVNSPIARGSTIELRSGMDFQVDIIPATGAPYFTTNIEDGIALADDALRAALAASYPEAWARIQARRRFMAEALGVDLHPDVLPPSTCRPTCRRSS